MQKNLSSRLTKAKADLERKIKEGPVYSQVRHRIQLAGAPFLANSNISRHLKPGDLVKIANEVEFSVRHLLRALVIDPDDPQVRDTPRRVAKMLLTEVFAGRYKPAPAMTKFPNSQRLDECMVVGPITVRSACAHHLVPIMGHLWIGIIPDANLVGLSKLSRLAEWILARPQIQEEAIVQLADWLEAEIAPIGLGVIIRASHLCCGWRGVKDPDQLMTTSVMRGVFRTNTAARSELLKLAAGQGA